MKYAPGYNLTFRAGGYLVEPFVNYRKYLT
jgi:hypothetical protein